MIPFNRPTAAPKAMEYIATAIESGKLSGDGPFTKTASDMLSALHAGSRAFLTTSCTHALELSALLMDLKPGDEVILPSFTFVSTANAFVLAGARPVFVDILPSTLNIDPEQAFAAVTDRTRAVVPVHYAGRPCDMLALARLAESSGAYLVEDNAHGLFAKDGAQTLGTKGHLSTLSFHETKNLSTGEGGALIVNDVDLVDRAEIIREKGTNRSRFFRGQVDKYTWVDKGSSFLPSELIAAMLVAQLEHAEVVQAKRKSIWTRYQHDLASWSQTLGVKLPETNSSWTGSYHMFELIFQSLAIRTHFIDYLKSRQILSVFHYVPLHNSPFGLKVGSTPFGCPVTERISDRLTRLPLYTDMSESEQDMVIEAVTSFKG